MRKMFLILCSLFFLALEVYADMGAVHAGDATVSEDSQKAIILHNGEEEILILGTDLKADERITVLRFIPFPAEPKVSLAPPRVFEVALEMLKKYQLQFLEMSKGSMSVQAVELLFREKLGAHDITVVKVNDPIHFREWVNDYFKEKGLPYKETYPQIEQIVHDYVKRGIDYFVFDSVEISETTKLVEPMAYRFKSKTIYYPLKTTNSFKNSGQIDLIFITPWTICFPSITPFEEYEGFPESPASVRATTSSHIAIYDVEKILSGSESFFADKRTILQLVSITYPDNYRFRVDLFIDPSQTLPYPVELSPNHDPFGELFKDEKEIEQDIIRRWRK